MADFYNEERRRYYGLRKGDIVSIKSLDGKITSNAEVIEYGGMDNNRVYLRDLETKKEFGYVAEWCDIVTKIEEKIEL